MTLKASGELTSSPSDASSPGALGCAVPIALLLGLSLGGAATFALGEAEGLPFWVSGGGNALLLVVWALLFGWGVLFASLLGAIGHLTARRAFWWAAFCCLPLLLSVALPLQTYRDEALRAAYVSGPFGPTLFQTLAKDYVVGSVLILQGFVLAGHRWRSLARALPVILVVAFAAALRISHLAWGLPGLLHPDEHRYMGPAIVMAARGDLNPHYFENPSLLIYATLGIFKALTPQSVAFHNAIEFLGLGLQDPRGDFLQTVAVRALSAMAGVGTVLVVYHAGKELFGRRAGLLGSIILAVSFLHVRNSHYATNDILAVLFLALSFLFAVRVFLRAEPADYLWAGVFGGLGTSTKYNAGVFFTAIVAAHLFHSYHAPWRRGSPGFHLLLPIAGVASLIAFVAGTPYSVLDQKGFMDGFRDQLGYGSQPWAGQQPEPAALMFSAALVQGFGAIPLVLAGLGVLMGLSKDRSRTLVAIAVPTLYFAFMATQGLFFARFALPVLPYLALMSGYGISSLSGRFDAHGVLRWAAPAMLVSVAAAQPLFLTLQHDYILGKTDTRHQAAAWIEANVPMGSSIAVESYAQLDAKFGWMGFEGREAKTFWPGDDRSFQQAMSGSFQYVVISSFGYGPGQRKGDGPSQLRPPYDELERRAKLVAVFGAGPGNGELPYALDDMYTPFWRLGERERPGPTIRIYRMEG